MTLKIQQPVTLKREELFEIVWKEPATKIAERYHIPYADFKKICDSLEIPIPGSGYWSKLRAGKQVPAPGLLTNYSGPKEVKIEAREPVKKSSSLAILPEGLEAGYKKLLKVSAKLTDPDKLIIAAKEYLEKAQYLHDGLAWSGSGHVNISVSPKNAPRALRFMDALIKLLKARGHKFKVDDGNYTLIEEERLPISLREKLNRSITKGTYGNVTSHQPSGIFILSTGNWDGKEWKDGKLQIEQQLASILAWLEAKGKEAKERRLQREKEEAERRERERIQRELEMRQEKELSRFKSLLQDAKRWKEVKLLREYITDMRLESTARKNDPEAHEAWLKWAEQKADWFDPQVNAEDELLDVVDKETLILKKKSGHYGW